MKVYVDRRCYEKLMDFMNIQALLDLKGDFVDLDLFYSDEWLLDSAVIDNVVERNGNWDVFLVFAHVTDPMKLIKRKITRFTSIKKAELAANYMRRLAAKDQRGTLKVRNAAFLNCNN
ncbi:hypothetical protein [Ekhidna sp.]|uniref:hypothetical protein n=1 Tax=Ekhidna sp. TaxID=2608089 RepID=UPI003298B506